MGHSHNFIDLTGKRFDRLIVSSLVEPRGRYTAWNCTCDCGTVKAVLSSNLIRGGTTSCGCLGRTLTCDTLQRIWGKYLSSAKRRGYEFTLTREQFEKLTSANCLYCGSEPNHKIKVGSGLVKDHPTFRYNGIDRVDNSRGYVPDNVVTCCGPCNKAKGVMTHSDFVAYLDRVAFYRQGLNQ